MSRPDAHGYTSYAYLEEGVDYHAFPMSAQRDRVPGYRVETTVEEDSRIERLVTTSVIASAHEHLSVRPLRPEDFRPYRQQSREVLPYLGMRASRLDVVFDGGLASPTRSRELWAWDDVVCDLGIRLADIAHQDYFAVLTRADEIPRLKATGRLGVVATIESASCIGGDLDRLDVLFGLGIRSLGLVYSESNRVGSGLADTRDAGLTRFGAEVVRRMNQLGMIIDVAHASDRTALDACDSSRHPVMISHAGARALLDIPRLKPDDVIRACAATGGVIGISASPLSTASRRHPVHTIESVMDHFEYCANLVGIDHVTFGLDTHFGDHVAWHRYWSARDPRPATHPVTHVNGCENPAESTPNVLRWLVRHGYSDQDIAAVCGGNLLRVMTAVWPR